MSVDKEKMINNDFSRIADARIEDDGDGKTLKYKRENGEEKTIKMEKIINGLKTTKDQITKRYGKSVPFGIQGKAITDALDDTPGISSTTKYSTKMYFVDGPAVAIDAAMDYNAGKGTFGEVLSANIGGAAVNASVCKALTYGAKRAGIRTTGVTLAAASFFVLGLVAGTEAEKWFEEAAYDYLLDYIEDFKCTVERPGLPIDMYNPGNIEAYRNALTRQDSNWDPLTLDLNGDGIKTIGQEKGVHFDLDNNDFKEKTGWINSKDGLLTLDKNNNGTIDDGSELFGTETKSGFEMLGEYDSNSDNKIDKNDEIYSQLKVWQDKNQNGESEADELYTLKELDIKSINLNHEHVSKTEENGNVIRNKGNYESVDGEVKQIKEFLFSRDLVDTEASEIIEETEEIKGLPELRGYGNVHSLRQAMLRDDKLIEYVEEFMAEKDSQKRQEIMNKILFTWTESEDIDPDSRGGKFDARKLNVLEDFFGTEFNGMRGRNPIHGVIPMLETSYDKLSNMVYSELMLKTHLKEINQNIVTTINDNGDRHYDFSKVSDLFSKYVKNDSEYAKSLLNEFTKIINSYDLADKNNITKFYKDIYEIDNTLLKENYHFEVGNDEILLGFKGKDKLSGSKGKDKLLGGTEADKLHGNKGADILQGEAGKDKLYGGKGSDILEGGKGSDYLNGGYGNDVYRFEKG
ncbi:calcium-binding protein, partial [Sporohalobacter salinus]|uniref:calcium-binding protein n=1 Tax=Sporohalobacter salinus TaxID=1494606 RepID=UPI0023BA3EF9